MATVASSVVQTRPQLSVSRLGLAWAGSALVAPPAAVLLHELGHHLAHLLYGFANARLHYDTSSYDREHLFWEQVYRGNLESAAAIAPLWRVGVSTAAGLLMTYVLVAACCYAATRYRPRPLFVALGVASSVRFLSGLPTLVNWFSSKPIRPGTDEVNLGLLLGLPEVVLVELGLFVLAGSWFWLVRSIPKGQRAPAVGVLALGTLAGFMLYFRLLGPWLLP